MKRVDAGETVIFRMRKSMIPIVFLVVFTPIWLYFGSMFLLPGIREFALGTLSQEGFYAALVALAVFLPVVVVIAQSYFRNQLIVTDRRIYIRKGLGGRYHVLDREDVRSFQHVYSRGRSSTNNRIRFYLHCGRTVRTGELYATLGSLQDLLALMRTHYEGRGFTSAELREMRMRDPICRSTSKIGIIDLIITLMPFSMALLLTVYYYLGR